VGSAAVAVGVGGVATVIHVVLRGLPAAAHRGGGHVADEAKRGAGEDEREDEGLGEHEGLRWVRAAGHSNRHGHHGAFARIRL